MAISRDNKMINEIMATPTSAILLMKSDGENIGFFAELSNFYKKTFWFNADYDNLYSFAIELAAKIFADDQAELDKLVQYKHCDLGKDNVIVNEILNKISAINGDCLMIMDNLELLTEKFNYPLLELFLTKCPRNLKIVMVSDSFIDINYNIFTEHCPKILDYNSIKTNDKVALFRDLDTEAMTFKQQAYLAYLSQCAHVDGIFAESIWEGGREFLDSVAKKCRSAVFVKNGIYAFHSGLNYHLTSQNPKLTESEFFADDINLLLCEHYIKIDKCVKALELSLKSGYYEVADRAVASLLNNRRYDFTLSDYATESFNVCDGLNVSELPDNLYGIRFFLALCLYLKKEYVASVELADRIIELCDKNSVIEYHAHNLKFFAYYAMGHVGKAVEYARTLFDERSESDDLSCLHLLSTIFCRLSEATKKSNMDIDLVRLRNFENLIIKTCTGNEVWYAKVLQAAAETYFECGNYGMAIEYIDKIKKIIPFYVIPYKLMEYYYYIGDMAYAYETAKTALNDAITHNLQADLSDIYILLAKVSMYFNRQQDAVDYIEKALSYIDVKDVRKYYAITIRSLILAKTGKAEYGRDVAMIYARYCEYNSLKGGYGLYSAIAYCCWRLHDYEQALSYALKCVEKANVKSGVWLLASAISISVMLDGGELRNAKAIVEKVLNSSVKYGMITVISDYYDCFEKIINYAKENDINREYLSVIEEKIARKTHAAPQENVVYVHLMGTTSVSISGKEIQWKTKKAKELFLLYMWYGKERGIDRGYIISALWHDYVYVSAINNLKTTNNIIRNTLNAVKADYKLDYGNSKYVLTLKNVQSDYDVFMKKLDSYDEQASLSTQLTDIQELLSLYNGGFATEINNPVFEKRATELRERILLIVVRLLDKLVKDGRFIEVKRLLSVCEELDVKKEFTYLTDELSAGIKEYYERY